MDSLKLLAAFFVLAIFSVGQGKLFCRKNLFYLDFTSRQFQYREVKMRNDWSAICSVATINSSGPYKTWHRKLMFDLGWLSCSLSTSWVKKKNSRELLIRNEIVSFSEWKKSNYEVERLASSGVEWLPVAVGRSRLRRYWSLAIAAR